MLSCFFTCCYNLRLFDEEFEQESFEQELDCEMKWIFLKHPVY